KAAVGGIVKAVNKLGIEARGISSDRTQEEREEIMRAFKNKQFPILVATDVLSRGIDIDSLSHVVNYDIPRAAEDYVHRIGRTARAATKGTAITFISDQDQDRVVKIEKLIERDLEKKNITEELGLGPAPEFDPKRFAGLGGKIGGRPERGGRSGGGSRDRGPRGEGEHGPRREGSGDGGRDGGRPPRRDAPDPKDPKHIERMANAKNALAALDAGYAPTVPYQRPPRPEGEARPERRPRPEGQEGRPPREPRAPRPEGEARLPREPQAEGAQPQSNDQPREPRAEGERRRSRGGRNRNRGPRPEGSPATPSAE
ncbi:MAG: box helicase, partial [Hymenobacter sp.]|nr:box helicase [Hymenobacter sp.]